MSISDRIVLMRDGVIQQEGKPQEIYDNPCNLFVAKFLGNPPINLFSGEIKNKRLYIGGFDIMAADAEDRAVTVGIRPEGLTPSDDGALECEMRGIEVMGRDVSVIFRSEFSSAQNLRAIISAEEKLPTSATRVKFSVKTEKIYLFDAVSEERIFAPLGEGGK